MNRFTICLLAATAVFTASGSPMQSGYYSSNSNNNNNNNQYGTSGSYQNNYNNNQQQQYSTASNGYSNQISYSSSVKSYQQPTTNYAQQTGGYSSSSNGYGSSASSYPEAQLYRGRYTGKMKLVKSIVGCKMWNCIRLGGSYQNCFRVTVLEIECAFDSLAFFISHFHQFM